MGSATLQRVPLRVWARAVRPFSFTGSVLPVAVAAVLARYAGQPVRWELLAPVALGVVLIHAATNLVSDAADFRRGVDRADTLGGSGVLVEGLLRPGAAFRAGLAMFALAGLVGVGLLWARGLGVLGFGLAGVVGGYFYGGRSGGYKYYALGDPLVFLLMGPLLVLGAYFVLTGTLTVAALGVSVPVGFLVTAILCANNIRDIPDDQGSNVRTIANLMGPRGARMEYYLLLAGAYVAIGVMVVLRVLPLTCGIVLLSVPAAWSCMRAIRQAQPSALVDVQTAKLHFLFSLLLCAGLLLGAVL